MAKVLKVPSKAIKNFDEQAVINVIQKNYDSSTNNYSGSFNQNHFNPINKIVERYGALVKREKEKVDILQQTIEGRKQ